VILYFLKTSLERKVARKLVESLNTAKPVKVKNVHNNTKTSTFKPEVTASDRESHKEESVPTKTHDLLKKSKGTDEGRETMVESETIVVLGREKGFDVEKETGIGVNEPDKLEIAPNDHGNVENLQQHKLDRDSSSEMSDQEREDITIWDCSQSIPAKIELSITDNLLKSDPNLIDGVAQSHGLKIQILSSDSCPHALDNGKTMYLINLLRGDAHEFSRNSRLVDFLGSCDTQDVCIAARTEPCLNDFLNKFEKLKDCKAFFTSEVDGVWIQEVFGGIIDMKKQAMINEIDGLYEELIKWKYDWVAQVCDRCCINPKEEGAEDAFLLELYHNSSTTFPQLSERVVGPLKSSKNVRATWNGEEFVWEWHATTSD
jgi:hypothetical protein